MRAPSIQSYSITLNSSKVVQFNDQNWTRSPEVWPVLHRAILKIGCNVYGKTITVDDFRDVPGHLESSRTLYS